MSNSNNNFSAGTNNTSAPSMIAPIPPTNFNAFVTDAIRRSQPQSTSTTSTSSEIDQHLLRTLFALSSSFLLTDTSTSPPSTTSTTSSTTPSPNQSGIQSYALGLSHLIDLLLVLHTRNTLQVSTVSAASRACSEAWTIAGSWRGMEDCRQRVREAGERVRRILDPNERTYKGERVYAP